MIFNALTIMLKFVFSCVLWFSLLIFLYEYILCFLIFVLLFGFVYQTSD
jgi:hypothetical protein